LFRHILADHGLHGLGEQERQVHVGLLHDLVPLELGVS
jgi:hypothetical protein